MSEASDPICALQRTPVFIFTLSLPSPPFVCGALQQKLSCSPLSFGISCDSAPWWVWLSLPQNPPAQSSGWCWSCSDPVPSPSPRSRSWEKAGGGKLLSARGERRGLCHGTEREQDGQDKNRDEKWMGDPAQLWWHWWQRVNLCRSWEHPAGLASAPREHRDWGRLLQWYQQVKLSYLSQNFDPCFGKTSVFPWLVQQTWLRLHSRIFFPFHLENYNFFLCPNGMGDFLVNV